MSAYLSSPGSSRGELLAAAAVLFGMFYPLESGLPCPKSYAWRAGRSR